MRYSIILVMMCGLFTIIKAEDVIAGQFYFNTENAEIMKVVKQENLGDFCDFAAFVSAMSLVMKEPDLDVENFSGTVRLSQQTLNFIDSGLELKIYDDGRLFGDVSGKGEEFVGTMEQIGGWLKIKLQGPSDNCNPLVVPFKKIGD